MPEETNEAEQEEETYFCTFCEDTEVEADEMLCEYCYDNTAHCENCEERRHIDDLILVNNGGSEENVCEYCYQSRGYVRVMCEECDTSQHTVGGNLAPACTNCGEQALAEVREPRNTQYMRVPCRSYYEGNSLRGRKHGEIVKSSRAFGVEIECFATANKRAHDTFAKLPQTLGVGTDGSIRARKKLACELRTPKLAGKRGEDYINEVCANLAEGKYRVNVSCGLHIHIDASDFYAKETATYKGKSEWTFKTREEANRRVDELVANGVPTFGIEAIEKIDGTVGVRIKHIAGRNDRRVRNLIAFYSLFSPTIASFLPRTRRTNNYANPILHSAYELLIAEDIRALWQVHYGKYFGVNFSPLWDANNPNIEIRYHSGTTNARKINEWANLHTRIVDIAPKLDVLRLSREVAQVPYVEEQAEMLFKVLRLAESSRQYFRDRQAKFRDGKLLETGHALPINEKGLCVA